MNTIPLSVDGYTDLPPGKIANVVTFFEIDPAASTGSGPERPDLSFRHVRTPDTDWYRALFRQIGEEWLWFSRAVMPEAELRALLGRPGVEVHVGERGGEAIAMAELAWSSRNELAIEIFGVLPAMVGGGVGRWLMAQVLELARRRGAPRAWLHTCTFDHPRAVPFYLACGFRAWKYAIEVSDDPRRNGHLARSAAPHVPFIPLKAKV